MLEWDLRSGTEEERLAADVARSRGLPSHLDDLGPRPLLFDDLAWVWDAFGVLTRTRKVDGMAGPQPIGVLEIDAYVRLRGLDGDDADELLDLVLGLDRVFMAWVSEQRAKRAEETRA